MNIAEDVQTVKDNILLMLSKCKIHKHRLQHETLFLMQIAFYKMFKPNPRTEEQIMGSIQMALKSAPITGISILKFLRLQTDIYELYLLNNERFYNSSLDDEINKTVNLYKAKHVKAK